MLSPEYSHVLGFTPLSLIVRIAWSLSRHPASHLSTSLTADEGGATRMSGGVPAITLPAGYLGSSFIGACLIACGFDINASKVAYLVLAVFFLFTLWWARRNWLYVLMFSITSPSCLNRIICWGLQNMGIDPWHVWPYCSLLVRQRWCSAEVLGTNNPLVRINR